MSTISLRLPDSLHEAAREKAKRDHISVNQLVSTALAKKLSAPGTADYLTERAKRASGPERFRELMEKAPGRKPERRDRFRGEPGHVSRFHVSVWRKRYQGLSDDIPP